PVDVTSELLPLAPAAPPGPPIPPFGTRFVPTVAPPPGPPLTSTVPAIVTLPLARSVTGVLAAFGMNFTVTPLGMLIVVKLNTPACGSVNVLSVVGLNAPSAPVLPLLKL